MDGGGGSELVLAHRRERADGSGRASGLGLLAHQLVHSIEGPAGWNLALQVLELFGTDDGLYVYLPTASRMSSPSGFSYTRAKAWRVSRSDVWIRTLTTMVSVSGIINLFLGVPHVGTFLWWSIDY